MPESFTEADTLRAIMDARISDVHTAQPGRIESYDAATQTATVQPMVPRAVRDLNDELVSETLPAIPNVPIVFPRSGSFFVSFPIAQGDGVLLVFSERSVERWRSSAEGSEPGDLRLHGLQGAFAIPGVFPMSAALQSANADHMALGADGPSDAQIHIRPADVRLGSDTATDFVALASQVLARLNQIQLSYDVHTHASFTAPPVPLIGPLAAVGATKVKAL